MQRVIGENRQTLIPSEKRRMIPGCNACGCDNLFSYTLRYDIPFVGHRSYKAVDWTIGSNPVAGKGPFRMLTLHHERKNSVDIVIVDGVLNADSSQQLETLLESLITNECPNILVDAEKLTYISSAGVGCFIGVIKRIRDKNGDLRFSSTTPPVQRVFNLLDLEGFFKFFPNLQEGMNSFE